MTTTADAVVIGAGIAGASAAWALAEELDVVLVEAEAMPGVHATGRSAALLTETVGSHEVRALVAASRPFIEAPPDGFCDHPLSRPRGVLYVATADDADLLRAEAGEWARWTAVEVLDADSARALVPRLRSGTSEVAVHEPGGRDLDVDALLQGYMRGLRARGSRLRPGAAVTAVARAGDGWSVTTKTETIHAAVVVDAAGAWADLVAAMAGVATAGLRPMRRTAFTFAAPDEPGIDRWPLVVDAGERWYVKPDAGRLLGSPADETPSDPCDARPEQLDVALGVERLEAALDLEVRGVGTPWAGLRTFAPDRVPVAGPDPDAPGFVWLAGQGGFGIKTAPALAAVVASHVLGRSWPALLAERGVTPSSIGPARLRAVPAEGRYPGTSR